MKKVRVIATESELEELKLDKTVKYGDILMVEELDGTYDFQTDDGTCTWSILPEMCEEV